MSHASIWIGFDPRESAAFAVARQSIRNYLSKPIPVYGIVLAEMQRSGLYTRPTETRKSAVDRPILWDVISDAPMSTEFAISRFLTVHLARRAAAASDAPAGGWALFTDCDVMVRADLHELFALADDKYAVMCVKHKHAPVQTEKMDGQVQTAYPRKNWSSVCLYNLTHPANSILTPETVNQITGRDLHRFAWLEDDEIGELGPEWNYLVGHTKAKVDPKIVHWTDGWPGLLGYENAPFADEWRHFHNRWARAA